jgi:hypothetical protein
MNIENLYINSLLSQMAYAKNLEPDSAGADLVSALTHSENGARDATQAQAQYFANNFRVVEQQETTTSGFSATLFQNIHTNEYHFSMRGTDTNLAGIDWLDANRDIVVNNIARNQTIDMLNFYLRLITPSDEFAPQYKLQEIEAPEPPAEPHYYSHVVDEFLDVYVILAQTETSEGLNAINSDAQLSLTGHSLGGHLASEFALLFPDNVADTTTFNSAGFIGWANNEVNTFNTMLADSLPEITSIRQYGSLIDTVTDITAPLDLVSNLGSHLGVATNQFEIQVESVPGPLDTLSNIRANHSIDLLSDSLAVINFMYTLDNSITIEKANVILQQSANQMNLSLEGLMSHFPNYLMQALLPLLIQITILFMKLLIKSQVLLASCQINL